MRILLDGCVPARLRDAFPGHAVRTVTQGGWRTSKDHPLLTFAQERFDVFVIVDRKLEMEHDLTAFKLGFIIVLVPNSRLDAFKPIFSELKAAAEQIKPGQVIHIASPGIRR